MRRSVIARAARKKNAKEDPDRIRRNSIVEQSLAVLKDGRVEEAKAMIHTVLAEDMEYPPALHAMGLVARDLGQIEISVELIRRAITGEPREGRYHSNLAKILDDNGNPEEAFASYRQAAKLAPDHAGILNNYGHALMARGDLEKSLKTFLQALKADPESEHCHSNISVVYERMGDMTKTEEHARKALSVNPDLPAAHFTLAQALMYREEWHEAWGHYEHRFFDPSVSLTDKRFPQPRWQGEDLKGKKIIVYGEQGIGDELRFMSMVPSVIEIADKIVLETHLKLFPLFKRTFPELNVVPNRYLPGEKQLDGSSYQVPIASVGQFVRTTKTDFPSTPGYLKVDAEKAQEYKKRLDDIDDRPKIGVCWRSMMRGLKRDYQYARAKDMEPIFKTEGVTFVNLQYDDAVEELDLISSRFGVNLLQWDDIDLLDDLDSAAALTSCLDLVVSASTSVSATAGAIGIPTIEFRGVPMENELLNFRHDPWFTNHLIIEKWDKAGWRGLFKNISARISEIAKGHNPLTVEV